MKTAERNLLYIDMAYTVEMVKAKNHHEFIESRHSNGYFKKVWAVHPLADIADGQSKKLQIIPYSPNQVIIEGVAKSMAWPRFLFPLNFFVSQYKLARQLVQVIRQNNISLITTTDPFYGGLLGLYLKTQTDRPLCVLVYGNYDEIYEDTGRLAMPRLLPWHWLEKRVARYVFRRADLVVGGNKNNLQYALNNGAGNNMTAVFPVSKNMYKGHLLDPAQRPSVNDSFRKLGVPLHRRYLLFLGRLLDVKRPDDAMKAMKVVMDKDPSVIGIFAGEGPMRDELEKMAIDLGIRDNVFLPGNLDQDTLSFVIPHCITLSPLTGMALIECGLGGSPVVAFDRDWQAEFVQDGFNGYVVPFRDYKAMGEKALLILGDEAVRKMFSHNMRKTALNYTDTERLYANEHRVFDQLFGRSETRKLIAETKMANHSGV